MLIKPERRQVIIVGTKSVVKMVSGLIESIFQKRRELMEIERKVREKEEEVEGWEQQICVFAREGLKKQNKEIIEGIRFASTSFLKKKIEMRRRRQKEKQKEEEAKAAKDSFRIHPFLTGYVYGKDRKRLEHLDGLYRVDVKDGLCEITGKTPEAVNRAMEELQVAAKKVLLHTSQVGSIFGHEAKRILFLREHCKGVRIISLEKFPRQFELLKEGVIKRLRPKHNRSKKNNHENRQEEEIEVPEEIENAEPDSLFTEDDIINLCGDDESPEDALILIGRKTSVEACIVMIELTLQHLQQARARRQKLYELRDKIKELKGLPVRTPNKNIRAAQEEAENGQRGRRKGQRKDTAASRRGAKKHPPQEEYPEVEPEEQEEQEQPQSQKHKRRLKKNKQKQKQKQAETRGQEEETEAPQQEDVPPSKPTKQKKKRTKRKQK
ncbi:hypothetical protein RFI_08736 [Reticulomyxa filosa]|uniref:Uncharacterized protein n=1 Tax=Reticulomyxa filosa TaxID=46433 RepID=X6NSX2_RETFI|nr:hypothetical protein RFI_08736 [Reticulomyxa filosa]|eukprot:ETO28387.1 hypothetical protein RFI_08736 [Reticulomyxa filosa]